jgi:hypothetical protein
MKSKNRASKRTRRKPVRDYAVTVRLNANVLNLIRSWQDLYSMSRSDVLRHWIAEGLHAINNGEWAAV